MVLRAGNAQCFIHFLRHAFPHPPCMTRRSTVPVRNAGPQRSTLRSGRASLVAILALLALFSAVVATPEQAGADRTVDALRAKAKEIAAQIERNNERISMLDEEFQFAKVQAAQFAEKARQSSATIAAAEQRVAGLRKAVARRAVALYRNSASGTNDTTSATTLQERGAAAVYTQAAASRDNAIVDDLRRARDAAEGARRKFTAAEAQQRANAETASKAKAELLKINAEQDRLLNQNDRALAAALQAERDRIAAANEAAARQREAQRREEAARREREQGNTRPRNGGGSGGGVEIVPPSNVVAPNPRAQKAIDIAMAQRGKPYLFAAAGPDRFDCSGLLVYAWGKVGVSVPHSSRAMWAALPHVPMSAIQPGDFVYFGNPIHHVAMYIGNGNMIESPHTGAVVRVRSSGRKDLRGATRVP